MGWCEGRLTAGCSVLVLLLASYIACCDGLDGNGTDSPVTGCIPREITDTELALWANTHSNAASRLWDGRPRQLRGLRRRRRRRRRDLLVSDTECSPDNLCHPTARPRVCYDNTDICDGVRDCDTGRDELYCDECLCPYQRKDGVSMNVPNSGVRYWRGINLQGCARACNDVDAGCVAFSFSFLKTDQRRCRTFFVLGQFVANGDGDQLYVRNEPSVPRLTSPVQAQNTPLGPQAVTAANCSSLRMHFCASGKVCLPYSQLCDGIQQCPGGNVELLCELYVPIYSRLPGKTLGSYSTPLPPVSLEACAAYCLSHASRHPKCLFFAYRSEQRQCLIGCSSCGDAPTLLDDAGVDYYSASLGGAASLASALLDVAISGKNDTALESLRPTFRQVTESLKTLGVSIPSQLSGAALSKLVIKPSRTALPTVATARPAAAARPSFQGKPGNTPSFSVQGNSANVPSSSFSGANAAPSIPSSTPQLPAPALAQLPADCGRRPLAARAPVNAQTRVILSSGSSNRVVNGQRAEYGAYPWQAQIQVFSDAGHFEHHCGGALIGERLVLTAAHCLRPALSRLQVKLGQHDRRDAGEQHEQTFAVENALSHPGYRSDPARGEADDLAVLKLRLRQGRPVVFSSHVQPLCLPSGAAPPGGQECHISGWGKTDPSASSAAEVLHGAVVPIVSDTVCAAREVYGERFVAGRMVCAGHLAGGPDACQGDSGGPLACPAAGGRWQLTGIVSFGEGCGGLLKPGVYTRVGYYVPWIQRAVQLL